MSINDNAQMFSAYKSPLEVYQSKLGIELIADSSQEAAIVVLNDLFIEIVSDQTQQTFQGLYLWGDVGRGKTFLMDLFYDCLPDEGKLRLHFHRFMARIHKALQKHAGMPDPLVLIANDLAKTCRVLCFDEFFVSDIGDAMILAGLFECLFAKGVVLVATSNTPIERLYENGLARHKFLPCIALLQKYTQTLHINGEKDHRMHTVNTSLDAQFLENPPANIGIKGEIDFNNIFNDLTIGIAASEIITSSINVCHREIQVVQSTKSNQTNSVVWFDFAQLCDGPRSQLDYMEIANSFGTVLLSGVPQLGGKIRGWIKARGTEDGTGLHQALSTGERIVSYAANDNAARRFISLIDELYDQNVQLYLSCERPLNELYTEGALMFEFRRTYSRLIEMSRG
jgi:cell division protein ZapE